MRTITFAVKPMKAEENMIKTIFAFILLLISFYVLIGALVFPSVSQGHETPLDPIYKPVVEFFKSKL